MRPPLGKALLPHPHFPGGDHDARKEVDPACVGDFGKRWNGGIVRSRAESSINSDLAKFAGHRTPIHK
jgi:hypothetical protein